MTKIVAVIQVDTAGDAERQAQSALSKGADLAELRLDHLRDLGSGTIRRLANSVGSRAIATIRSPVQGGGTGAAVSRRAAVLKEVAAQRFAYVDLELETDRGELASLIATASRHRAKVIVSHHFSEAVDRRRASDALDACAAQGDVAKVAAPIDDIEEAIEFVDLARTRAARPHPSVLIGMGTAGMITRALAEPIDQQFQYASWGRAGAAGQLPLGTATRLRGRTPIVLGLLGHPLEHSLSPAIHEAALAALGLPGVYLPFDTPSESLDTFLLAAERLWIRGFNVTIPHKEAVARHMDELDADAERLGAVNTVVFQDGWSKGHNTDVYGFRVSLRSLGIRVGDRKALVVGAGGAAKAVVYVLLREGAHVQVTARTAARADALADSFDERADVIPSPELARSGPWDLLVNATPLGTKGFPPGPAVPEAVVAKAGFVYDLVYNPAVTPLLQAAKRRNRPWTSGLDMLLHQAAKAFELWTGQSAPFEAMARAAKEALR